MDNVCPPRGDYARATPPPSPTRVLPHPVPSRADTDLSTAAMLVGLKPLVISLDYRSYMDSSVRFDHFGDCFYTCALIIWMVPSQALLGWPSKPSRVGNLIFVYSFHKI
jgi:hypothetical protein